MKIVLAGATGLVGSHLLQLLLEEQAVSQVIALTRRPLQQNNAKYVNLVVDFSSLSNLGLPDDTHAICSCLGTTAKQTPDAETYFKIEHDYPVSLARLGLQRNVPQFHYISSMGANATGATQYVRFKGQAEEALKKLDLPELYVYRPSLITGNRNQSRLAEQISGVVLKWVNPLLSGTWKKYRSIEARTIAAAVMQNLLHGKPGNHLLLSDVVQQTGDAYLKYTA